MQLEAIRQVAVLGTGTMGPGIALSFALRGYSVTLVGRSAEAVARGQTTLQRYAQRLVEGELNTADETARAVERIAVTADLATIAPAQVVVEAIAERLDAKQDLLRNAEELVAPTAVLASTTSGLSATALGSALQRPERFVVAHYANPPHLMPVVEVVKGRQTSEATADLVLRLLRHTGKRPVLVRKDVPGFIFNRLQYALMREAVALVRDGVATPEDVDAIVKYGYALRLPAVGPLEMVDLVGLEIYETIATYLWPDLDCSKEPTVLRELLAKGAKGMVAGQGFYRWTPETIEALLRARDAEIVRQVKRLAAEERERPDGGGA